MRSRGEQYGVRGSSWVRREGESGGRDGAEGGDADGTAAYAA